MRKCIWVLISTVIWFVSPAKAEIEFLRGPVTADEGKIAKIWVPEGFSFVPQNQCKEFYEKTGNLYTPSAHGVLIKNSESDGFLVFFEFDNIGYIKDAASEKLDPAQMWDSMVKNGSRANEERAKRGWPAMELVRWEIQPRYNAETQRLEWAQWFKSEGAETLNFNTRILGRRGVMQAILVPGAGDIKRAIWEFNSLVSKFEYQQGNRYAEWTKGDKLAKVGLAALVVGGATAAAANTGLLGKLWKLIVVAFLAFLAFLKKIWNAITGRSGEDPYNTRQ